MRLHIERDYNTAYVEVVTQLLCEAREKLQLIQRHCGSPQINELVDMYFREIDQCIESHNPDAIKTVHFNLESFFVSLNTTEDGRYFRNDREERCPSLQAWVHSFFSDKAVKLAVLQKLATSSPNLYHSLQQYQASLFQSAQVQLELIHMLPRFYSVVSHTRRLKKILSKQASEANYCELDEPLEFAPYTIATDLNSQLGEYGITISEQPNAAELPAIPDFTEKNSRIFKTVLNLRHLQLSKADKVNGIDTSKQKKLVDNRRDKPQGMLDDVLLVSTLESLSESGTFEEMCARHADSHRPAIKHVEQAWLDILHDIALHPTLDHSGRLILTTEQYEKEPFTHYILYDLLRASDAENSLSLCASSPVAIMKLYVTSYYSLALDWQSQVKLHNDFLEASVKRASELEDVSSVLDSKLKALGDLPEINVTRLENEPGFRLEDSENLTSQKFESRPSESGAFTYSVVGRSEKSGYFVAGALKNTVDKRFADYQLERSLAEHNNFLIKQCKRLEQRIGIYERDVTRYNEMLTGELNIIPSHLKDIIVSFNRDFKSIENPKNILEQTYQNEYLAAKCQIDLLKALKKQVIAHNQAVAAVKYFNNHTGIISRQPRIKATSLYTGLLKVEAYRVSYRTEYTYQLEVPEGANESLQNSFREAEQGYRRALLEKNIEYNHNKSRYQLEMVRNPCQKRIDFLNTILEKIIAAKSVVKFHSNLLAQQRLNDAYKGLSSAIGNYTKLMNYSHDSVREILQSAEAIKVVDAMLVANCRRLEESIGSRWRKSYDAVSTFLRGLVAMIISRYNDEEWILSRAQKVTGYMGTILTNEFYDTTDGNNTDVSRIAGRYENFVTCF